MTTTTSRTALRLDHTRELLTLLPYQLGFHPQDSVVLVALRPPGRTLGLVARLDLPDVLAPEGVGLLSGAVAHLEADGAREVVVVVYGDEDDPRDAARGLRARPGSPAVRAAGLARGAGAALGPVTVWYVAGGRYLGLGCRDRGCCPPGGRALAELTGGELAGRLAGRGEVVPTRADVGVIPPAATGPRRSAAAARSRWLDTLLRASCSADVLRWRQRSLDGWRAALAVAAAEPGAPVTAATLGRVEAGLLDPVVRDAVVLTLVGLDADLPDALLRVAPDAFGGRRGRDDEADAGGGDERDGDEAADDGGRAGPGAGDGGAGSAVERAGEALVRGAGDGEVGGADPGADAVVVDDETVDGGDDRGREGDAGSGACDGGDEDARAVSHGVREALDGVVDPVCGREPDDALVGAARTVLEQVVAHGRRERQAPALTVLALLAWWGGDGVRASVLVERAIDDDPGYRLADLVDRALGAGLPPGWLRRRC